jgi:nucleoside-diphosphate-sugar epimerase
MIYGMGLDANIMRLAASARRFGFLAVYGKGSGLRHPVQADDLAQAAIDASFNPLAGGKCYNLGGDNPLTYREMLVAIFRYLGKKPRIVSVPFMPVLLNWLGRAFEGGRVNGEMARRMNQDLLFDMKDAMNDFGYRPKGFLEGEYEPGQCRHGELPHGCAPVAGD